MRVRRAPGARPGPEPRLRALAAASTLAATVLVPSQAVAQPPPSPPRLEILVGGSWVAGQPAGSTRATLTENRTPTGGRFTLFETDSELASAATVDVRVAYALTRILRVEAGMGFGRPELRSSVRADAEQASDLVVGERVSQYVVDAGLVADLRRLAMLSGRAIPFVAGGAGYLRQLHEGRVLVETGQVFFGGGGVRYVLRQRPASWLKTVGTRVDVRAVWRRRGVDLEGKTRVAFALGGGLFVGF